MHVRERVLAELAAGQRDLVAGWQLREGGWTRAMVEQRMWDDRWRQVHAGVYALTRAPLTQEQVWQAATLTAPDTYLAMASAGACFGVRQNPGRFETVVRPGTAGPRRFGSVLVSRSKTLAGETTTYRGIPITTPERTLIDLAAHVRGERIARATREAIRLRHITARSLLDALERHRGRRGTRALRDLALQYKDLPLHRTRSDGEGRSLHLLQQMSGRIPHVNETVAGHEADLVDHERRLILEIDGPQFHLFPDEDEKKERDWRAAGYDVGRIPSGELYR